MPGTTSVLLQTTSNFDILLVRVHFSYWSNIRFSANLQIILLERRLPNTRKTSHRAANT